MSVTRRTALRWGLAAAATAAGAGTAGTLTASGNLHRAEASAPLGLVEGRAGERAPDVAVGALERGSFRSVAMGGAQIGFAVSYPPRVPTDAPLPVVLELYGRGGSYLVPFARDSLALGHYQSVVVGAGAQPFAVATVDAGPTSYWHKRSNGVDPQRMILSEYLPLLRERGLLVDRIALLGESMGGYGALLLAQRLGPARVAAVATYAPAIFRRAADASPGAFDDAADFAENDVLAGAAQLSGIPMRIVCGTRDRFFAATKAFAALPHTPAVETAYEQAGHAAGYWRSETTEQLTFLARHLAAEPVTAAPAD